MWFYSWDSMWTYVVLILPALIITMIAQSKVHGNYNKYARIANTRGLTGAQIARMILDRNGLYDVKIGVTPGQLSDHYDPRTKTVNLSSDVYNNASVSSLGIAAHEVGHAIQHAKAYAPLNIRNAILPAAQIGSTLTTPLILMGIIFSFPGLISIGIIAFAATTLFQLITLPVEFNASKRALQSLSSMNIFVNNEEYDGTKKVLSAAAMTYVASLLVSLLSLLRLVLLFGNRNND